MKAKRFWPALAIIVGCILMTSATFAGDKVVCFGDSYTAGPAALSFPDYLEFLIDPGDSDVVNEGEGGETSDEAFWRMLGMILIFEHFGADVWTITTGGNDLIDWLEDTDPFLMHDPTDPNYPYEDELNDLLETVKFNIGMCIDLIWISGSEAVLGTYMQVVPWLPCDPSPIGFFTPGLADKANTYMMILNDAIREVAADKNVDVNDLEANLPWISGHLVNYYDCLHPNTVGNFSIALAWWLTVMPYI